MIIEPHESYYRVVVSRQEYWIAKENFPRLYDIYKQRGEAEAEKWLRVYGSRDPPYITPTLRNLYRELYGPR